MIKYEANADPKCQDSDLVVGGRFSHIVTEVAALVHGVYQALREEDLDGAEAFRAMIASICALDGTCWNADSSC